MPPRNLAINPLPWILGPNGFDLSVTALGTALRELHDVGYDAVHADIPEGMSPPAYSEFISELGFRPAPGYFAANFESQEDHRAILDAARAHAAAQAALGLTEVFVANNLVPPRIAKPAMGTAGSSERLAVIAEGLAEAAEVIKAEGVTPGLHSHVGSWIETEEELRSVLDATAGSPLGLGADTGHIAWAGGDPAGVLHDYAGRIVALHLKDVDATAARSAEASGADYAAATNDHHVWTEPGRGSVDFDAVFGALPSDFDGWFVVEVDVPNIGSPTESARSARDYLLSHPYFSDRTAR